MNHSRRARAEAKVSEIWGIMSLKFGAKWANQFDDSDDFVGKITQESAMNLWISAIKGLRPNEIDSGINLLINSNVEWPPSPSEFRSKFCLIGKYPDMSDLFNQTVNWRQLQEADKSVHALWIIRNMDYTEFRRADTKTAKRIFSNVYEKLKKKIDEGFEFPEIPRMIDYLGDNSRMERAENFSGMMKEIIQIAKSAKAANED